MLNRLLLRFRFVRELHRSIDLLNESLVNQSAVVSNYATSLDDAGAKATELQHALEIERTKRIAAEQIAVSRGTELDWLREQFNRAETQREEARAEQLHSLDLVNIALLKGAEADRPPTKEEMAQWRPVPKQTRQSIPMMRRAESAFLNGLRAKSRPAVVAEPEKVQ